MTDPRPSENTDRPQKHPVVGHKAQAEEWAKGSHRSDLPLGMAGEVAAIAQAHATLALVEAQQETNRHLEAIAHELRLKNRVVGL